MMRVKVPGGVLTAAQTREIGLAAEAYGRGPEDHPLFGNSYCDITTRQTVQLTGYTSPTSSDLGTLRTRWSHVGPGVR